MARREVSGSEQRSRANKGMLSRGIKSISNLGEDSIFDVLKTDHQKVRSLFEELESAGSENIRHARELFKEIQTELLAHTEAEQKAFYDVLRREDEAEEIILEAMEEHHVVRTILEEAAQTRNADRFLAKMKVLKEIVNHHVEEEENEIFKHAQELLDDDEERKIAKKFEKLKQKFMTEV